jgi:glucosamine kinase
MTRQTSRSEQARGVAIGIDAGASTTDAVLVDADGVELARASAGGANLHSVDRQSAEANLSSVISRLVTGQRVRAICIGAAGAGRDADRDKLRQVVKWAAPPRIVVIVTHDGEIALRAATSKRPAMVVIAGTGSLAYGERSDGTPARAGGYGAFIGDPGSGHAIGLGAIAHTARALDGVEPMGALATDLASELGAKTVNDIIERMEEWPQEVSDVATLAARVAAADRAGDPAAREILARHEQLLGALAARVAREVRDRNTRLVVALSGGAYEAVPTLVSAVTQAVTASGPCEIVRPERSPAAGAAEMALERLRSEGAL